MMPHTFLNTFNPKVSDFAQMLMLIFTAFRCKWPLFTSRSLTSLMNDTAVWPSKPGDNTRSVSNKVLSNLLRYSTQYWAVQVKVTCLSCSRQDRMCGHWGVMISAAADEVGISSQNKLKKGSTLLPRWQSRFTEQTTLHLHAQSHKHT